MKTLGLILLTLLCLTGSVVLVAWPDLLELRRNSIWSVKRSDLPSGQLQGVEIRLIDARAMILPGQTEKAIVSVRLGLRGDGEKIKDWMMCDLALTNPQGQIWRPQLGEIARMSISVLDGKAEESPGCDRALTAGPDAQGERSFVEAFTLPAAALDDLRLRFSAMNLRPEALSLPLKPRLILPPQ